MYVVVQNIKYLILLSFHKVVFLKASFNTGHALVFTFYIPNTHTTHNIIDPKWTSNILHQMTFLGWYKSIKRKNYIFYKVLHRNSK